MPDSIRSTAPLPFQVHSSFQEFSDIRKKLDMNDALRYIVLGMDKVLTHPHLKNPAFVIPRRDLVYWNLDNS